MALEFISGFGPDHNDWRLQIHARTIATITGWTFPTTTDDAVAPPDGARWLKAEETGATTENVVKHESITPKAFQWMMVRGFRLRGTLGVGEEDTILVCETNGATVVIGFAWLYESASTFKIEAISQGGPIVVVGTSSTVFSVNTTLTFRLQLDGTNVKVWINDTLEINTAFTPQIDNRILTPYSPQGSGQQHYFSRVLVVQSDDEDDRPGTDVEMFMCEEDGDWATEQDYGDDGDCDSTDGVAADIALDGSDQVNTGIYWCELGGTVGSQMVELTTNTFSGTIVGAIWRAVGRANLAAKTVTTHARLHDGTSASEVANENLGVDTFGGRHQAFPNAPDGGAWTQADVDNLKAGISGDSGNGANDEWAGGMVEVFAVDLDPPPVTVSRRRLLGQVV